MYIVIKKERVYHFFKEMEDVYNSIHAFHLEVFNLLPFSTDKIHKVDAALVKMLSPKKRQQANLSVIKEMHRTLSVKLKEYLLNGDPVVPSIEHILRSMSKFMEELFDNFENENKDEFTEPFYPVGVKDVCGKHGCKCIAEALSKWTRLPHVQLMDKTRLIEPVELFEGFMAHSEVHSVIASVLDSRTFTGTKEYKITKRLSMYCAFAYSGTISTRWTGVFGQRMASVCYRLLFNPSDYVRVSADELFLWVLKKVEIAWALNKVPSQLLDNKQTEQTNESGSDLINEFMQSSSFKHKTYLLPIPSEFLKK